MTTLGEIVRQYGPAYRAQEGEQLLPSQLAALHAIEQCRTEALGGHIYTCPACGTQRYSSHSCRNRHCPTCQHDAAQTWLARQQELLLPLPYFLVTFTLPAELRDVAYRHQRILYNCDGNGWCCRTIVGHRAGSTSSNGECWAGAGTVWHG